MKLRSNRVFNRGKPSVNLHVKIESFSERRLSLRSSKLNCGKSGTNGGEIVSFVDCDDNLEMGMKEGLNSDDKGLFLGSEVLDPVEDLVVSCREDEVGEEEGNESVSVNLSETGHGFKEEVKSPHVECENGSKSLESETFVDDKMIVNGDDDEEMSLDDQENSDHLGECKEMKEKGKHGRKKKRKNVVKLKKVESNQEKTDVIGVNGDDDECTPNVEASGDEFNGKATNEKIENDGDDDECMPNVEALGADCHRRATNEEVEEDGIRVTGTVLGSSGSAFMTADGGFRSVVLGLKRPDDIQNKMLTEGEDMRPKKKLKSEKPCKLKRTASANGVALVNGGSRAVVLGLKPSEDVPNMRPRSPNTRPKKKLKRRERPCKRQGEIISLPLNEIPIKKVERRGRPRKVSPEIKSVPLNKTPRKKLERRGRPRKFLDEITSLPKHGKGVVLEKSKGLGRPPKMEAKTLATNIVKMRTVKLMPVKKRPKICKNVKFEGNSEFLDVGKGIAGGIMNRKQLKQLIRDKISDIFLKCGWTVDRRQRGEKTYTDAVYIEPDGKRSHWSITGAYAKLKSKIENNNADDNEISGFTPMPEEEISMLFRQCRKERKKKNKIVKKVKKGKSVTDKKKKHVIKSKDGSKRKMIFKPRVLARGSENGSKEDNEGVLVIKRRNLLSWMIDSGVILLGTKVQYGKTRRQKRSSEGVITNEGICCGCCNEIMGISRFVGHCGGQLGQVFDNLYLESGVCLRKCLIDSWRKEEESDVNRFNGVDIKGDDPNDDTCNICGDGGDLVCCDGCPSTFHQSCLDVENFPSGDWNCIYCTCKFCGVVSVSTSQVEDPHDEVTSQMLSCCLCEEKFHQLCVQEVKNEYKDSNGLPFCGRKCRELFERLQMYIGVKHELEDGFSWTLLQRFKVDQDFNLPDTQLKVEQNSKLAVAFSVMDECFIPIVDERSGTSIIRNVVYNCGSNVRRLNYSGFLTAVLEKDDEFITAASIRIHGYRLAEMPFIGTRHIYRRQGMCRRLLDAIECTLSSLGVEELIIPAIPALLQTWTDAFGFMPLEDTKKQEMKCMSMMVFPGIAMLKKPLLKNQFADVDDTPSAVYNQLAVVAKDVIDQEKKEEMILLLEGCSSRKPNDENNPQLETTSSNATDCKQTSADSAGVAKDIFDYQQTEKETVLMVCCSGPNNLENDNLPLYDLNLPVRNVVPCDIEGQTSVDSESFLDCTIEPSSLESVICRNPESSELKLDVENDAGVKVNSSSWTSSSILKNTFDLNLQPTAVETDMHIINDESVQRENQDCVKLFELSDSRSQVDQSGGGQTDSEICETQPRHILTPFREPKVGLWQLD